MSEVESETTVSVPYVSIADLEAEVFEHEGVRIVVRVPSSTRIICGYKNLFKRNLGDERSVSLLVKRIKRMVGQDIFVDVVDGYGTVISGIKVFGYNVVVSGEKVLLGTVRKSYNKK